MDNTTNKSVELIKIVKEFNLEKIYAPENVDKIMITRSEINRPGLQLTGFFEYFTPERIQIFGRVESIYLSQLSYEERYKKLNDYLEKRPVCLVIARSIEPPPEMVELAKKYEVPFYSTGMSTTNFVSALIASLNIHLAPTITRHGVLVEVYGEGVLILGDSGIGKSETAIELVKRGHRLVADDAVELKRVSAKTIVGSAPEVLRHYTELRGIGIVDVRRTFGIGAVKDTEKVDMVLKLEHWDKDKFYDRIGLDMETTDILGLNIPTTRIPVSPGRNLAVIIEIAAMNNKQRRMGYNTAEHFTERLSEFMLKGQALNF